MHEGIIEKLYQEYTVRGFISEEHIFDVLEENGISLFDVEYICDRLLGKGVIIQDEDISNDSDEVEYDRSQTDYSTIYEKVIEKDPYLIDFVEYVKKIKAPQHREWQNLLPQAQSGNNYARTRVFEMYVRVVIKTALVLSEKYNLEISDAIQDGLIGLHTAIDKFEFGRQDLFTTYFPFWVRQAIMREAATRNPTVYFPVHVKEKLFTIYDNIDEHNCEMCIYQEPCPQLIKEIAKELDCSNEDAERFYQYTVSFESVEYLLEEKELQFSDCGSFVETMIDSIKNQAISIQLFEIMNSCLTDKERDVILLRFGFGNYEIHTLEMVGERLGVTRERVRQIEAKSLRKLRREDGIKRIRK